MKLVSSNWEHTFKLGDGECYRLVIENPITFRTYLQELRNQLEEQEGNLVLSENNKILKLKDHVLLIDNPLVLDTADKKITLKLLSSLKNFALSEDIFTKSSGIIADLEHYALSITDTFDQSIKYSTPDIPSLIKFLGFEIDLDYEDPLEMLLEYFNVIHSLCGITTFIIVNLTSYFSEVEISLLLSNCISQKHSLLLIESHNTDINADFLKTIIIDKDNCEIF